MNKKNSAIILGIIILALAGAFYFNQRGERANITAPEVKTLSEEDQIKVDNAEAMNIAGLDKVEKLDQINKNDHIQGSSTAPVKMIIYGDYACPYTAQFMDTVKIVQAEFKDKLAVIFRHFPLKIHNMAYGASMAVECAGDQGKFWEMGAKVFEDNKKNSINMEQLNQDVKDLKLNAKKFTDCLNNKKFDKKIAADLLTGQKGGIVGTPTTLINGEFVIGATPLEDYTDSSGEQKMGLRSLIQKKLAISN